MSGAISRSDILRAAADLIEPPGRWTQRVEARIDPTRRYGVDAADPRAGCWCAIGAVKRCSPSWDDAYGALVTLTATLKLSTLSPRRFALWNDRPKRTQQEVVAQLRQAADEFDAMVASWPTPSLPTPTQERET